MGKLEQEAQILKRFNQALAAFNAVLDQLAAQKPAKSSGLRQRASPVTAHPTAAIVQSR